tara:strand:+ start:1698 stop:1994 length:297 start_codon:yes stop_codon:yes gene_type:complete
MVVRTFRVGDNPDAIDILVGGLKGMGGEEVMTGCHHRSQETHLQTPVKVYSHEGLTYVLSGSRHMDRAVRIAGHNEVIEKHKRNFKNDYDIELTEMAE